MSEYGQIKEQISEEMAQEEYNLEDTKITHVENLFIISYLTKALQDLLIRKARFFQYPLLIIDLPLALAILIVNVERVLYVRILGYVLAHIQYDVSVLRSVVMKVGAPEEHDDWKERAFAGVRKVLRFVWGLLILLFILPVWPLIWVYNKLVQTMLIAMIYYFLMFFSYDFPAGFLVYYILLLTVTFLVSSMTVPFIFQLSVYVRALFSLERKTWKQVNTEARTAFVKFYQRLHDKEAKAMPDIKVRYAKEYKAEGGVYYMLLKFLHLLKNKLWQFKEKKMDMVVEKIQDKTVEFVDDYYEEKRSYYFTLGSLSAKDLRRTVVALSITLVFSIALVMKGSHGKGIIGPILHSFVKQDVSQRIWIDQRDQRGYYEDMFHSYVFLPNFLKFIAIGVDNVFHYFFKSYYFLYPLYLEFLVIYYTRYVGFFLTGLWWGTAGIGVK